MNQTLSKGIFKRGGTYAVRFSVPTELQKVVGKREVIRSLGTTNLAEAAALRDTKLREIRDGLFSSSAPVAAPTKRTPTGDGLTIKAAAHRWLNPTV